MRDLLIAAIGGATAACAFAYLRHCYSPPRSGKYCAGIIKANPELIDQYMRLHDATWEEVMARMYEANMRDFVVWLHEETNTMFHQATGLPFLATLPSPVTNTHKSVLRADV